MKKNNRNDLRTKTVIFKNTENKKSNQQENNIQDNKIKSEESKEFKIKKQNTITKNFETLSQINDNNTYKLSNNISYFVFKHPFAKPIIRVF